MEKRSQIRNDESRQPDALLCWWLAFYAAIFTLDGYHYLRSTLNYAWFGAPR